MVEVHIQYFAQLRDLAGRGMEKRQSRAASLTDLYGDLAQQYGFPFAPEHLRVAVNDAFAEWNRALQEGDKIVFIPPVTGG